MNEWVWSLRPALAVGLLLAACPVLPFGAALGASDLDAFTVTREAVFEFAQKPTVARAGDRVTIEFETKDFCDATVAIEDEEGRILRHLASGVLGPNAPAPFRKHSKKQAVAWDGKDDRGAYVDDKDRLTVRVSLGLRARFERTLFFSPKRRTRSPKYERYYQVVVPAPEGLYVYDGGNADHIRLFDHDGAYVRTVYPPPASRIREMKGLLWRTFPQDGRELPLKWGLPQYTFLTSGNVKWDGTRWPTGGGGTSATCMAVNGKRMALVSQRLNRLGTDGSSGGVSLIGPKTCQTMYVHGVHGLRSGDYEIAPQSSAFSPDGKQLYITGFRYHLSWRTGCAHGVTRMDFESNDPPALFKGNLSAKGKGTDNDHFNYPTSVDCDAKGRVYVSDFHNDRIQVFAPDGKHLKMIPVSKPARVVVNRSTGEIYVFSYVIITVHFWYHEKDLKTITPAMRRFASFDDPKPTGAWPLPKGTVGFPRGGGGLDAGRFELDFHTDPPTLLAMTLKGPVAYEVGDRTLRKKWDFISEVRRTVVWDRAARHMKQRIYFNPKNKFLYIGDLHDPHPIHVTGFHTIPVVDTRTGKVRVITLPFDAEDMAFDGRGRAYLRTADGIARYDADTWKEAPFDYGMERRISSQGLRVTVARGAITHHGVLGVSSGQLGGMCVSPKGHVAVTVANPTKGRDRNETQFRAFTGLKDYVPVNYPGRARPWEVHVFDTFGRLVYEDAVPSTGRMDGVLMDKDDNLYVLVAGVGKVGGEKYLNPMSCTLIKMRPRTRIVATKAAMSLPLEDRPKRDPDSFGVDGAGDVWIEKAEWVRGGVGFDGKRLKCHCESQCRPAIDGFARLFLPEIDRFSVLVIDTNNNEVLRIGRYGNVDDGVPLGADKGVGDAEKGSSTPSERTPLPRSVGGDEVALMHGQMLAVESDRRLFVSDLGNQRIVSVRLHYHANEKVALKDVRETK